MSGYLLYILAFLLLLSIVGFVAYHGMNTKSVSDEDRR